MSPNYNTVGQCSRYVTAQSEPKNHKKEKKIWEKKWSQICIETGWDNPDKMSVLLAPKLELWRIKSLLRTI